MSAGSGSVFPRIAEDHPLAEAARATNALAEERGLEATLELLGIGSAGELAYLAEQRALRAIAAVGVGVNMGAGTPFDERVARAVVGTPLWRDMRLLLVSCYLDGFAIGWKGRELADEEEGLALDVDVLREHAHKEMEIARLMGPSDDAEAGWLRFVEALVGLCDRYRAGLELDAEGGEQA